MHLIKITKSSLVNLPMSADMADGILAILDNWGVMNLTKLK